MKLSKVLIVLMILFLPCLFYNSSGVASLGDELYDHPSNVDSWGEQLEQVIRISYRSLLDDISKIGG